MVIPSCEPCSTWVVLAWCSVPAAEQSAILPYLGSSRRCGACRRRNHQRHRGCHGHIKPLALVFGSSSNFTSPDSVYSEARHLPLTLSQNHYPALKSSCVFHSSSRQCSRPSPPRCQTHYLKATRGHAQKTTAESTAYNAEVFAFHGLQRIRLSGRDALAAADKRWI